MKIHTVDPLRSSAVRRGRKASGSGFADALPDEPASSAGLGASAQIGVLSGLLAAQEVEDDAGERDRRATERGHSLLDELESLRLELLVGGVSRDRLQRLSGQLAARREAASDPGLAEVIAEIELRTAVELAKLER